MPVKLRLIIYLFTLLIFSSTAIKAQNGIVVLLQGKITQEGTNTPVGIEFDLISTDGKKLQVKSNSSEGDYQQIIKPGLTYHVIPKGYLLTQQGLSFEIPNYTKYTEVTKNFSVKKIERGLVLNDLTIFDKNKADLTGSDVSQLHDLKDFLLTNIKVSVDIMVNTHDSYFKTTKKKEAYKDKKGRTKYKRVKVSTIEQLKELAFQRIENLRNYLLSLNINAKRFNLTDDVNEAVSKSNESKYKPKKKKKKRGKSVTEEPIPDIKNTKIIVGKIMNL